MFYDITILVADAVSRLYKFIENTKIEVIEFVANSKYIRANIKIDNTVITIKYNSDLKCW